MKLIMENWRKYLSEIQETEECPEFSFYMDGNKIRRYGGEDDSGPPGKPLTDEELILLGRDDECGKAAREDLEAWIEASEANFGSFMIPDFSPSLDASKEEKENSFNVFGYFKKFFDSLGSLVNKKATKQDQKTKKPYQPYSDNEEGFNIDCPTGYSIDPITGQERDPTETRPCSEEEMTGNCWINVLTDSCIERAGDEKKPIINFSILKVTNLSFKNVFCRITKPGGRALTVSDMFENIINSQLKSVTLNNGEKAGLGVYEGTFGYRRVYFSAEDVQKVLKSSFCPIPEFKQNRDEVWSKISNDSRDEFYMLIPILDSGPCRVSFVQKERPNAPTRPIVITPRLRPGFGDGPYAKISITSIKLDAALPEELERNVQSSQELVNLKTSPDYGLKVVEKENGRTRWTKGQLFNVIRQTMFS